MIRPFVSVVVSTRNRAGLLADCLRHLLAQDAAAAPYELLVVDNASSDRTASIVESFRRRHPAIVKYLYEPRPGVSCTRNAGFEASRGDILAFTDDDVRVSSRWIAEAASLFSSRPDIDYLGGPVVPVWRRSPPAWLTQEHWAPIGAVDYGPVPFEVPDARAVCLIGANLFMRRGALGRVGPFDPAFTRCQDHEMMLRLWAAGLRGLYAPRVATTTVVLPERTRRSYHRTWYGTNGHFLALMPLREEWRDGRFVVEPAAAGRFMLGVPLFEYRSLLAHARRWLHDLVRRRPEERFRAELDLRYSTAFIATCMSRRARRLISGLLGTGGEDARAVRRPAASPGPAPSTTSGSIAGERGMTVAARTPSFRATGVSSYRPGKTGETTPSPRRVPPQGA